MVKNSKVDIWIDMIEENILNVEIFELNKILYIRKGLVKIYGINY